MSLFKRFFGHLKTVMRHRKEVRKLCFKCGLYWQGLTHDLSKYSPVEFFNGVKYFTGTASPHYGERKDHYYSKAWLHHKGRNKHHVDYWQDIRQDGKTHPINMPYRYFAEMICDRIAASKIYLGDKYTTHSPFKYLYEHKNENDMNRYTLNMLFHYLAILASCGEDYLCATIKQEVKRLGDKHTYGK